MFETERLVFDLQRTQFDAHADFLPLFPTLALAGNRLQQRGSIPIPETDWIQEPDRAGEAVRFLRARLLGGSATPLIFRHTGVDFFGPGEDAAADAFGVFEALFAEEIKGFQGANAGFAVD